MDHELKQRLIGAVVVTALCAIFIPMLFDDPVETGNLVTEIKVPAPEQTAIKLPENEGEVLKQPESESLPAENTGEVIESTGAEEEAEPEAGQAAIQSPGFEDSAVQEPETIPPKSHPKQSTDAIPSKSLGDGTTKSPVRESHLTEPVKPIKLMSPVKSVIVKKTEIQPSVVPKEPVTKAETKPSTAAKSLAATVAEAKKPEATIPKAPAKLVRWYIQVGSFSKKDNAMSLWDSLREQGLPASLDTVQTEKGISYRLRVGPELDEKKASAMKSRLDKQNIKAILISE